MFILRYIDDLELRMAIKNLLNRIELGNRLSRAIAVGKPREFSAGDKEEQETASSRMPSFVGITCCSSIPPPNTAPKSQGHMVE